MTGAAISGSVYAMDPFLIFGLGNPGREYEHTYHNAGALCVAALKESLQDDGGGPKSSAAGMKIEKHFWYCKFPPGIILAGVDPAASLYMNESGLAVREALAYFKLPPERLVLLHDDSDLPLGDWRLETDRGAAGHHGVESAIQILGTTVFWRGRIGIRPAEAEGARRKAGDFVLKPISEEDQRLLAGVFKELGAKILALGSAQ